MMERQPLAAATSPAASSPSGEVATTDWPVLAELPWIGGAIESHQAYTGGSYQRLDSAEHSVEQTMLPPRFADVAESPPGNEAPRAAETMGPAEANARRWRIDSSASALSVSVTPPPHASAFLSERTTIAARFFQWHAALAPHAGLSLTAALVIAVGVLSWLTFGPRSTPAPNKTVQAPLWPKESTAPLTLHLPANGLTPTDDLSQFSWSARLLPKPVPAKMDLPTDPIAQAPAAERSDASALPTPQSAESDEPAPNNETLPVAVSTPNGNQVITPTPNVPAYPSTRFFEHSRMIDPSVIETPAVSATPTSQPSR